MDNPGWHRNENPQKRRAGDSRRTTTPRTCRLSHRFTAPRPAIVTVSAIDRGIKGHTVSLGQAFHPFAESGDDAGSLVPHYDGREPPSGAAVETRARRCRRCRRRALDEDILRPDLPAREDPPFPVSGNPEGVTPAISVVFLAQSELQALRAGRDDVRRALGSHEF